MEMPQSFKHTAQAVSTRVPLHSATLRLVKVESGINGLLPTSWAPPIYPVSLLTKLRCALGGNDLLRSGSCSLVPRSASVERKREKISKNASGTLQRRLHRNENDDGG